tara:strand:- start:805 stop:1152 length:348 start_codon:yes stop_codon:yes gene_type:complete
MAKTIDADLLQKQRDSLVQDLTNSKVAVETAKNRVQQILGAIQMTDSLIAVSKEGNYSKSRANSEGVPETSATEVQKSLEESAKDVVSELGDDAIPDTKLSKDEEQLMRLRKDKT